MTDHDEIDWTVPDPPRGRDDEAPGGINLDEIDYPIEVDCPTCERRHVVDPDVVKALLAQERFNCSLCGRFRPGRHLTCMQVSGHWVLPVCDECAPEFEEGAAPVAGWPM